MYNVAITKLMYGAKKIVLDVETKSNTKHVIIILKNNKHYSNRILMPQAGKA